jgi:polysaccharide export outer membrane protein
LPDGSLVQIGGLKMPLFAQLAKAVGAIVLSGVFIAGLGGCNGVPGDGATMAAPEQPEAAAARVENKYAASTRAGPSYLIGPMDVLEINVFKAPDLSKSVPVSEDGVINLPLLGGVPAAGKSTAELERDIQRRLDAGYMRSPQVNVIVKEFNSQRVTVEGAVANPGVFPLRGRDTLEQAIAKAGGVDRDAASDSVTVFRLVDGSRRKISYDLGAIRGGQAEDPEVAPGDLIVVGENSAKVGLSLILKGTPIAGYGVRAIK